VRVPVAAAVPAVVSAARAAVACGVGGLVTRIADLADGGARVAAALGGSLGPRVAASDARLRLGPHGAAGGAMLVVAAPLGRLGRRQAALIGGLLRAGEVLRLGIAGRVVIPLAQPPAAALASLAGSRLLTSDGDELAGVTACSGTACLRAVADVRALARPLPGHPRTHWVACPRGCGKPPDADLIVAAGPDSFLVPGQPTARPLAALTRSPMARASGSLNGLAGAS
jgi:precorrin-3B synthase